MQILRVIDSLQLTAKHSVATPVDWYHGDKVMVVPTLSDEQATAKVRSPPGPPLLPDQATVCVLAGSLPEAAGAHGRCVRTPGPLSAQLVWSWLEKSLITLGQGAESQSLSKSSR